MQIVDLGLVEYQKALTIQKEAFSRVKDGSLKSCVILCQHTPVITLGRLAKKENIKVSEQELACQGIPVYSVERGGDVSYHGPGQLMVYPIVHLASFKKDIHYFLRFLEDIALSVVSECGVCAQKKNGATGVWVQDRKIASIGITVKNWITFHGLALNLYCDDRANFSLIRPCGMDIEVTSVEAETGTRVDLKKVKEAIIRRLYHAKNYFA